MQKEIKTCEFQNIQSCNFCLSSGAVPLLHKILHITIRTIFKKPSRDLYDFTLRAVYHLSPDMAVEKIQLCTTGNTRWHKRVNVEGIGKKNYCNFIRTCAVSYKKKKPFLFYSYIILTMLFVMAICYFKQNLIWPITFLQHFCVHSTYF